MTLGLFLLRAYQLGLTLDDLDGLEAGFVVDMMIESGNDEHKWRQLATQDDMSRF